MDSVLNEAQDDFINEYHAENKINFLENFLCYLSINQNSFSKEDWMDWRPRVRNICRITKNADLKKRGRELAAKFDKYFNANPVNCAKRSRYGREYNL